MKKIILSLGLIFSLNSLAGESVELFKVTGQTADGADCTYTIVEANHWEGQTIIFLKGPSGNFRVELDTDALKKGALKPVYDNVSLVVTDKTTVYTTPAEEKGDQPTVISLTYSQFNLTTPTQVDATALAESYNCTFQ